MNEQNKTPEQLRQEMIENLQKQNAQYMNEIAMPGVVRSVNPEDLK